MSAPKPLWKRILRRPVLTAMRAAEIGTGLAFIAPPARWLRARLHRRVAAPANVRSAMVAHVFYPELWPEVLAVWRNLPQGAPLFVTVPADRAGLLEVPESDRALVTLVPSENRGRDIAPFLALLQSGALDPFDAVLKVHTKKSMHLRQGNLRRRMFFEGLAGSPGHVARILGHFADPAVAMVGPQPFFRTAPVYWMDNRASVQRLAAAMQPPAEPDLGFFEGSMFWVRPAALAPLRSLSLTPAQFEAEAGQLDGCLHHAVERVFTLSSMAAGGRIVSLRGQTLMGPTGR